MLNSAILDVVIGLIFTFLSVSLAASAAVEALASILEWRSKTLVTGVKDLLNDPTMTGLAARLYAHALINPRGSGFTAAASALPAALPAENAAKLMNKLPAYIDSKQFASALMDILALTRKVGDDLPTTAQLQAAINATIPPGTNPQINQLLNGIVVQADGDIETIHVALSTWFDNAMDRVGGSYKRHTQAWACAAALLISIILNADAVQVAQRIWAQPVLISGLKVGASPEETNDLKQNAALLPFGWDRVSFLKAAPMSAQGGSITPNTTKGTLSGFDGLAFGSAVLGWLITALASLFGAPFWFDTLQQIVRLKGAGPSPAEKANKSAASA